MVKRILPAYPLFVKDPNFSLWIRNDKLNGENLTTWYGEKKKIYGLIKTEGKTYCFMGDAMDLKDMGVISATETDLKVTAFNTEYTFKAGNAELRLKFVSSLLPNDFYLMSIPVCYMEYEVTGADAEVSVLVNRNICYNDTSVYLDEPYELDRTVGSGVFCLDGVETAFMGLKRQLLLSNNEDMLGADWGYWYLAGKESVIFDGDGFAKYVKDGEKEVSGAGAEKYMAVIDSDKKGVILLGYDEQISINYFGEYLKGYYLKDHTITEAIEYVYQNYNSIDHKLDEFDKELIKSAEPFGKEYLDVLYASLRQCIAAHKLVMTGDNDVLFLSKENGSNGCIATVDVSYPSMPLFLLYNTELVKGMMRPILKFARMPIWTYDFAPHDVGTYPNCCGQVYGCNGKARDKYHADFFKSRKKSAETHFPLYQFPKNFELFNYDGQMPVEECANMIIMFFATYKKDGDISFFKKNADLCEKWIKYLIEFGLKPENQLCTDDFAGHLKNNINLAVKATVAIGGYAEMLEKIGKDGKSFREKAEEFAKQIEDFGKDYSHIPLTWDSDDSTFSLKYNMAFDKIFGLKLFKEQTFEKETDYYISVIEKYGVPLDSRKKYTKSDWQLWAARLTDDREKQKKIICAIDRFLKESDRVPFGDWYETENGNNHWYGSSKERTNPCCFMARSVQGGCFILLL